MTVLVVSCSASETTMPCRDGRVGERWTPLSGTVRGRSHHYGNLDLISAGQVDKNYECLREGTKTFHSPEYGGGVGTFLS